MSSKETLAVVEHVQIEPSERYQDVVALTGVRHSGKSTVAAAFAECGASVISADALVHHEQAKGSLGLERLVEEFDGSILNDNGELNRAHMAGLVYGDRSGDTLRRAERVMFPLVALRAEEAFAAAKADGTPLIVYEVPLLFETGLDKSPFQAIVVVLSEESRCVARIMEKDGVSEQEAKRRFSAQLPQSVKRDGASHVIENDGTLQELKSTVALVYRELLSSV